MRFNNFQLNLDNLRPWLIFLVVIWLLGSLGLGWLVNSLLIIVGLFLVTPIIGFVAFRWWLQRSLVTDKCPVCGFESTGLNNSQLQCPNCGEQLLVQNGKFRRFTPDDTIDITAIEVPPKSRED
ncbi:hypothetical protein [Anabaena sp. PCC 7108]|uniref:hypothetical protein n=1 Tax=Anabaena sp. PCC 7108 TaxID=163908 RepID=UPI00035EAB21|nr:hypothetical protein [Anabaena sp. PCC 7108]